MKYLILFLISFSAFAGFMKKSDIGKESGTTFYSSLKSCGSDCLKLPRGYNPEFHEAVDETENDITKPIYEAKSSAVNCEAVADDPETTEVDESKTIEQDCEDKLQAQVSVCDFDETGRYPVKTETEVYCTKLLGYEQKLTGRKIVKENASLKSAYEAQKAIDDAKESAIVSQIKDMDNGKRVYAFIQLSNKQKGLNKGQRRQLRTDFKEIRDDLSDGNICEARADISAITPDGTLVTAGDIASLLAEIDKVKNCP